MPFCTKCGAPVLEKMAFCPKCGFSLMIEKPPVEGIPPQVPRSEKAEKAEKGEKAEKEEKTEKEEFEKQESGYISQLLGGVIVIFAGLILYLVSLGFLEWEDIWPFFLFIIGTIIIVGSLYGVLIAEKRHPRP